jgi:hypothetical protein
MNQERGIVGRRVLYARRQWIVARVEGENGALLNLRNPHVVNASTWAPRNAVKFVKGDYTG